MQQVVRCPYCGTSLAPGSKFCGSCGAQLGREPQQQPFAAQTSAVRAELPKPRKYGALRTVAIIYRILGWVICVGGSVASIIAGLMAAAGMSEFEDFTPWAGAGAAVTIVAGILLSLLLGLGPLAFADLCYVQMDIEENTRQRQQ